MPKEYQLTVGKEEKRHLDALENLFGKGSREFLSSLKIKTNAAIADVGCGAGHIACWLAQEIVPHGTVIGIDTSAEQLAVAKTTADSQGIKNISFVQASVIDLSQFKEQFDLIYCRWLLTHIPDLKLAFQQMVQAVKPKGIIACEEVTTFKDLLVTYPEIRSLMQVFEYCAKLLQSHQCNPHVGYELYRIAMQMPNLEAKIKISQPTIDNFEKKATYPKQVKTLLTSIKPALIENNIDTEENLIHLEEQLDVLIIPIDYIVLASRMMQLWAIKQ